MKSEEKFAKADTFSIVYREKHDKKVFINELTNFPPALTESGSMYHSSKSIFSSNSSKFLKLYLNHHSKKKNVMVVDLSVVDNTLSNRKSIKQKTFGEFSEYVFVELNNLFRRLEVNGIDLNQKNYWCSINF